MQEVKTCVKCNTKYPKDKSFFSADRQKKDGLRSYCKMCDKVKNKENYWKSEPLIKQKRKELKNIYLESEEYRLKKIKSKNKDRARKRKWVLKNKDKIKESSKAYRESGKRIPPSKEKKKEYKDNYYSKVMSDPYRKMVAYYRVRMNKLVNGSGKNFKSKDIILFTREEFIQHIESLFKENMSWDNYGSWHIDHIRPIASFNLNDKDDMVKCWGLENLQPLWAIDNLKKGASW